eukprot:117394-Pleurochrysis_carterae.AAC.1
MASPATSRLLRNSQSATRQRTPPRRAHPALEPTPKAAARRFVAQSVMLPRLLVAPALEARDDAGHVLGETEQHALLARVKVGNLEPQIEMRGERDHRGDGLFGETSHLRRRARDGEGLC